MILVCLLIRLCLQERNGKAIEPYLFFSSVCLCRRSVPKWACLTYFNIKFVPTACSSLCIYFCGRAQPYCMHYYNYLSSSQLQILRADAISNSFIYIQLFLHCPSKIINNKYMFVECYIIFNFYVLKCVHFFSRGVELFPMTVLIRLHCTFVCQVSVFFVPISVNFVIFCYLKLRYLSLVFYPCFQQK